MKRILIVLFALIVVGLYSQQTIGEYIELDSNGARTYLTTSRTYVTETVTFSHSVVSAHGKPTSVTLGTHSGFSLPVYAADNEELFSCKSLPLTLDTTEDITAYIGCVLDTANDTKKFQLRVSWAIVDLAGNEVITSAGTDVDIETTTGNVAQYTGYKIAFPIASVAAGATNGNKISFRVYRIAASANEIAGEVVIHGMAIKFVKNKDGTGI